MIPLFPMTSLAQQLSDIRAAVDTLPQLLPSIEKACSLLVASLKGGHKVLTVGNGGSAAEAMHMAEELSGRYRSNRRSLPGISLTADGTALTCIGNDFGYDELFARQIEGLGAEGDVLVVFSTSGNAKNLSRAVQQARHQKMRIISLLGRDGGPLAGQANVDIIVPAQRTERIQEIHQMILHMLLEAVEDAFTK